MFKDKHGHIRWLRQARYPSRKDYFGRGFSRGKKTSIQTYYKFWRRNRHKTFKRSNRKALFQRCAVGVTRASERDASVCWGWTLRLARRSGDSTELKTHPNHRLGPSPSFHPWMDAGYRVLPTWSWRRGSEYSRPLFPSLRCTSVCRWRVKKLLVDHRQRFNWDEWKVVCFEIKRELSASGVIASKCCCDFA